MMTSNKKLSLAVAILAGGLIHASANANSGSGAPQCSVETNASKFQIIHCETSPIQVDADTRELVMSAVVQDKGTTPTPVSMFLYREGVLLASHPNLNLGKRSFSISTIFANVGGNPGFYSIKVRTTHSPLLPKVPKLGFGLLPETHYTKISGHFNVIK